MADRGACRACGAEMLWAVMVEPDGTPRVDDRGQPKRNPLDAEPVDPATVTAQTHAIALNPRNGHGTMVTGETLPQVETWTRAGATLHLSHFATCEARDRFRR